MAITKSSFVAVATAVLAMFATRPAAAVIPIEVTAQANLGFGQIVATTSSGTVTVSPTGVRTAGGGVVLGNGFGVSAAAFAITGEPNLGYSITLPSTCTLSGGGSSMTVVEFASLSIGGTNTVGPSGTQTVSVGATLNVSAGQASAAYSGTYAVTLAYN